MKKLGLYIHIPFCESKCDYCSFVSFCMDEKAQNKYIDFLIKEIEMRGEEFKKYLVDTIYIGGGTPSILPIGSILKILNAIKRSFVVSLQAEISIECNPNSLTQEKLYEYKLSGINRLSLGLQSYNNKTLKLIGRKHTKKDFKKCVKMARELGFENISADIILGLPNQRLKDVKKELKKLVKLKIKHISAYGLMVENGTKLSKKLIENEYQLPTEDISVEMYDLVYNFLQKKGFNRYEVSNFSVSDFECKHNYKYWQGDDYLGLGLVSSSLIDGNRWHNTENLQVYFRKIKKGIIPAVEVQNLSLNDKKEEFIMLRLRTSSGLNLLEYEKCFGEKLQIKKHSEIARLRNAGFIRVQNKKIYVTDAGFKVLNQIILELI